METKYGKAIVNNDVATIARLNLWIKYNDYKFDRDLLLQSVYNEHCKKLQFAIHEFDETIKTRMNKLYLIEF